MVSVLFNVRIPHLLVVISVLMWTILFSGSRFLSVHSLSQVAWMSRQWIEGVLRLGKYGRDWGAGYFYYLIYLLSCVFLVILVMRAVHDLCSLSFDSLCPVSYLLCLLLEGTLVSLGYRAKRVLCLFCLAVCT